MVWGCGRTMSAAKFTLTAAWNTELISLDGNFDEEGTSKYAIFD